MNEFKNDHDAIIAILVEVRQIKKDINDLKDGTSRTVSNHETRLEALEKWQAARMVQIRGEANYIRFILALGILILGLIIWHLTGYHL